MQIAIDISAAVHQHAGIARYTSGLTRALIDDNQHAQLDRLTCIYTPGRPPAEVPPSITVLQGSLGVTIAPLPSESARSWRVRAAASHVAQRPIRGPLWDDVDVFIAPDIAFPYLHKTPTIVVVHDLSFRLFPQFHTTMSRLSSMYFTKMAAASAAHILCDSVATRTDLIRLYGDVVAARSSVLYPGLNASVQSHPTPPAVAAVLHRHNLTQGDFILGVGTLEPRKNMSGLLRAYRQLAEDAGERGTLPPLAIVGSGGWLGERERLAALVGTADVRFLGFVPDDELAILYRCCTAFVYPSFAEGFGLPVVEALAAGAPVICSNTTSLPEAGGDAALYTNPHRPADLAAVLRRLLHDAVLREELAARGPAYAAQFTWSRAVEQLRAVLSSVVQS